MRLLLAEDETGLQQALTAILKHARYTVDAVDNGTDALDYALAEDYDGLILDVMMPGLDGFAVLKALREKGKSTPALFLTAKGELTDKITGLDLGADDYLTKPFEMEELLARIRAMTRRGRDFTPADLTAGNLTLHRASFELSTPDGAPRRLSGKEFQMMEMLMEQEGIVISADRFMERIWADADADDSVIWVNISNLRKKLSALNATVTIKARRGVGYYLAGED